MNFDVDMKYVYLIHSTYLENFQYKIGVSSNPNIRIKQLETGNPNQLTISKVFLSKFPFLIETALKNRFKYCRIEGEWFNLSQEEVNKFISTCENMEKNFAIIKTSTLYNK